MPLTRIYVPIDAAGLAALKTRREIGPAPVVAHAVTPDENRGASGPDEEALEYAALLAAAAQAGTIRPSGGRRVVAAADVEPALVERAVDESTPTLVEVDAPVPLRRVVSFHVDEELGGVDDAELLWFDVTELDEVLHLVTGGA